MKLKKIIVLVLVYILSMSASYATKLPEPIEKYIKKEVPNTRVRFDGLITTPNGTNYLPVFPAATNRAATAVVKETYPANKKFSQYPDVILFENNFALLKLIKNKQGRLTVTASKNIPPVIKAGVLPQDLLVPPGMILPDDMKIVLGNLKIPLISSPVNNFFQQDSISKSKPVYKKITPLPELKNKTLLITTLESSSVNVVPTDSAEPKFVLKLNGLPRFVEPVSNDNYIMVATSGKTFIDVADINQSVLAKKIDISAIPSEIVLTKDRGTAYVSASNEEAIFVIDIHSMALLEKIKITGIPKHMYLDEESRLIGYIDKTSGNVYTLTTAMPYINKRIAKVGNVSKLLVSDNKVYLLSRTENKLSVYDVELQEMIFDIDTVVKPIDMMQFGRKLYILSGTNKLQIFNMDDFTMEIAITIADKGFTKDLVKVPDSNLVLITDIAGNNYYVFDVTKNRVVQTVPTALNINDLKIMNVSVK